MIDFISNYFSAFFSLQDSQDEDGEDTAHAPGKKRSKETSQVDRRRYETLSL